MFVRRVRDDRLSAPLLLALWTLFVWGGRLRNLGADPGGFSAASRWSLYGSLLFTVLGVAVLVAVGLPYRPSRRSEARVGSDSVAPQRAGGSPFTVPITSAVLALSALTVGVWTVRAIDIALGDHSVGFIAVHVALAAISTVLAVISLRAVRLGRGRPADGTDPGPAEPGRSTVGYPATDG